MSYIIYGNISRFLENKFIIKWKINDAGRRVKCLRPFFSVLFSFINVTFFI